MHAVGEQWMGGGCEDDEIIPLLLSKPLLSEELVPPFVSLLKLYHKEQVLFSIRLTVTVSL